MGKRYGRNQKRAAREKIEILEHKLYDERLLKQHALNAAMSAESRANNATQEAFKHFAERAGLYEIVVAECSNGLGKVLGAELNEHKEKLLGFILKQPISLACRPDYAMGNTARIVEVRIPLKELRYNYMINR